MSIIEDSDAPPIDQLPGETWHAAPPAKPAVVPVQAVVVAGPDAERPFSETVQADLAPQQPIAAGIHVRHLRLGSVSRLAVAFVAATYVGGLIALVFFWTVLSVVGVVGGLEQSIADATGIAEYNLNGRFLLTAVAAVGFVLALTGAAASVVMAAMYNRLSEIVGGLVFDADPQPASPIA